MIGILAYGSLLTESGPELEPIIVKRVPCQTPFPVEYARRSNSRAKAPTLVNVPDDCGRPVNGAILILKEGTIPEAARDMLYRRELHQENNQEKCYDDMAQRAKRDALVIETLTDFQDLAEVYYTSLKANFAEILDTNRLTQDKADLLARAAIDSLTEETFKKGLDGTQYLHKNIDSGILTLLTEPYHQAILQMADNAPNLPAARWYFARQKGIAP